MTSWRKNIKNIEKMKIINILKLSDLQNHGSKKRIDFLAHLQAGIGESSLVTSWHDVMTSRHHTNENQYHFWTQWLKKRMEKKNQLYDTIRYEKSFVSAPLQINIHYESAAQL